MGLRIVSIFQYISNKMQRYTVHFIWKLLYMFRVVPPPTIRSANNCIYSIWYLSHRYCYLPLSWKSWNWLECAVGGVRHPQGHIAAGNIIWDELKSHIHIFKYLWWIFWYISKNMRRYTVYFIWKLLYMFWVVPPPIIRSANNCIYSIWYLSDRYCYLPL